MKKAMKKDILITGFAMFAIFFGSGNLIFPPQVGLLSGQYVFWAIGGLALSGILFPMLAVASVGNVGYGLKDMMKHVTSWWHYLYMGLGLLVVVFGTIPRCGGVAFETGMQGIFGTMPVYARVLFLLVFFGVSYYFAMNKSDVIDRIGKYLTPILLITLLVVIFLAIFHPLGAIQGGTKSSGGQAFVDAFLTGYNTGDVGTGIICAGIFITAFQQKGYTKKEEHKKMMLGIIAIGFLLLFIVYGGLAFLGAQGAGQYPTDVDTTYLLTDLVKRLAGSGGSIVLSLTVIFACLTTAVGMIATAGEWVEDWTKGKVPYKIASLIITVAIFLVSSTGVSNVLTISGPIFTIVFPMSVVMMVLGLCKKIVPNDGAWKGAVIVAAVMSLFDALNVAKSSGLITADISGIMNLINKIPLAQQGFAWVIPTIIGFFVGALIYKVTGRKSLPYAI